MASFIVRFINSTGYFAIVLLMFAENIFPPLPSEFIMPLAGFVVSKNELSFVGVVAAGVAGSVVGAVLYYYLGNKIGEDRVRDLAARHGRWLTVSPKDIDRANNWFSRHGNLAVFFCRLVPGIRSLISIPAGINQMSILAFLFFTTLGSAVWCSLLTLAGYLLKSNFEKVEEYLDPLSLVILGSLLVIYIIRVVRHK